MMGHSGLLPLGLKRADSPAATVFWTQTAERLSLWKMCQFKKKKKKKSRCQKKFAASLHSTAVIWYTTAGSQQWTNQINVWFSLRKGFLAGVEEMLRRAELFTRMSVSDQPWQVWTDTCASAWKPTLLHLSNPNPRREERHESVAVIQFHVINIYDPCLTLDKSQTLKNPGGGSRLPEDESCSDSPAAWFTHIFYWVSEPLGCFLYMKNL